MFFSIDVYYLIYSPHYIAFFNDKIELELKIEIFFQQLPISMYESVIDLVNGEATMLFVPLTYTLATEEAERIGVDHVARMCTNDQGENSLGDYATFI